MACFMERTEAFSWTRSRHPSDCDRVYRDRVSVKYFQIAVSGRVPFFVLFTAKEEKVTTAITAALTLLGITVSVGRHSCLQMYR